MDLRLHPWLRNQHVHVLLLQAFEEAQDSLTCLVNVELTAMARTLDSDHRRPQQTKPHFKNNANLKVSLRICHGMPPCCRAYFKP